MSRINARRLHVNGVLLLFVLVVFVSCFFWFGLFFCSYSATMENRVEDTCYSTGVSVTVCKDCGKKISVSFIGNLPHSVTEYTITKQPSPNKCGVQVGTCTICGSFVESKYICPHTFCNTVLSKEPTCSELGNVNYICQVCGKCIECKDIDLVGCSFTDWEIASYATPLSSGTKVKDCKWCGRRISEYYQFESPGENYLFIPGTGINNLISPSSFSQGSVDCNDIVYAYAYPFGLGEDDPFIIGHNFGTMGNLCNTRVGQYVYVSIDGVVETYKVVISEFALQNSSKTDIIGQTSNVSIFKHLNSKTLHMYSCYEGTYNGRWIVLAELVT